MNNKKQELSEEQNFERRLFNALKSYGYLFPENVKEVKRFEELYGNTEIDIPENLQALNLQSGDESIEPDFSTHLRMAAFKPKRKNGKTGTGNGLPNESGSK